MFSKIKDGIIKVVDWYKNIFLSSSRQGFKTGMYVRNNINNWVNIFAEIITQSLNFFVTIVSCAFLFISIKEKQILFSIIFFHVCITFIQLILSYIKDKQLFNKKDEVTG